MEEPLGDRDLAVWPDNQHAVEIFSRLVTQWMYAGMGVAVGLRHELIPLYLRKHRVPPDLRDEVWDDILAMEQFALPVINRKR